MRVLGLFSGIGGMELGLQRAGMEIAAFCEIDPFCRRVLAKHWPDVPCYDDVRTLTAERLEADGITADVVCGGFPCQDISRAGKRAGLAGSRSGLFWELVRTLRLVRPRYAILENVADLTHGGLDDVLGALAESGYDTEWDCVPAYACGSPQERDRIFIVAHAHGRKPTGRQEPGAFSIRWGLKRPQKGSGVRSDPNSHGQGELQPGWCFRYLGGRPVHRGTGSHEWRTNWLDRLMSFCGMADGLSRRLDESKPLGNAVIPQIPEMIGRAILAHEARA